MFLGALLALFSVDFKRTLACSSVSQIGFILTGVGMQGLLAEENALAVRGTFLHMVNHSLFKLVLFMVAGVIFMNLHKLDLNEIRGFGRKKPLLAFAFLMGALGIGGIPMWSGYISKTLLHESIVEYIHGMEHGEFFSQFFTAADMKVIEYIFLISGGITIAYMCKLFVAVFIEKNNDENLQKQYDAKKDYMNPASTAALIVSAILFPIMGILPTKTMDLLADMGQGFMGLMHAGHEVLYFTKTNVFGSMTSLLIGIGIYFLLVREWMIKRQKDGKSVYVNRWPAWMDLEDSLYRPAILKIIPALCGFFCMLLNSIVDGLVVLLRKTIYRDYKYTTELEEGNEVTHTLGVILNGFLALLNRTVWRSNPRKKDFEHQFALSYSAFKENTTIIGRSLSYGLLLFSLGLCATLVYLLVTAML